MKNKPAFGEPVRILFVVSRILRDEAVPYHSIVMRMINGLCKNCRTYFHFDVLRPPTYEQLKQKLSQARQGGKPYHILHFEGLGTYDTPSNLNLNGNIIPPRAESTELAGYLLFENITQRDFVCGDLLGKLLVENGVSVISMASPYGVAADVRDPNHESLRVAYESVLQACLNAGILGAVSMPWNGSQDAAAKFFGDLYAALAQGATLGEAAATVQKLFIAKFNDTLSLKARKLTPSVFEYEPCRLVPRVELETAPIFRISLVAKGKELLSDRIDRHLARRLPKIGAFGRDRVVLMLERAFDYQGIFLLHGEAGSGKTVAAAEFARWQANSAAMDDNPVLYTSFETCHHLTDVLDSFGQVYEKPLLERGIAWYTLDDFQRQKLIQDLLKKVPLLWIWDDFENVTDSWVDTWSHAEQKKLVEWLHALSQTGLRLLILSDSDENSLLGDLPLRIPIPPIPSGDLQKIADLIRKAGHTLQPQRNASIWQDIPGAITPQALILAVRSSAQCVDFSLNSMIERGLALFLQDEQRLLTVCGCFHDILNLDILHAMGDPANAWHIPELANLSREDIDKILERAGSIGLVEWIAGRYYLLQPAITSSLYRIFHRSSPGSRPLQAFVASMSAWCRTQVSQYQSGNQKLLGLFKAEETNIRNALALAHQQGWDDYLIDLLSVLRLIYTDSRRYAVWQFVLDQVAPAFINLKTGKPRRQRLADWQVFLGFRVEIAQKREQYSEAARWQQLRVAWELARLKSKHRPEALKTKASKKGVLDSLGHAVRSLGQIYQIAGKKAAISVYDEAFQWMVQYDQPRWAGVLAGDIAACYVSIPGVQNLDVAVEWIDRSLALREPDDTYGRSQCLALRGKVALEKFTKAQRDNRPETELAGYLNESLGYYFDALDLLPEDAWSELGAIHETLGYVYLQTNNLLKVALENYNEAIRYKTKAGDRFGAALASFNIAVALSLLNHMEQTRFYAIQALRGFEACGSEAAPYIPKVAGLLARSKGGIQ